ncbi:hypothetical protein AX777_20635 [Sphingobium yanoikuyae]|uniref:Secretin/TonB short N-terminal domain-containing protein n=2 Tax=Sphingobium yanoikuyae TaxID=13690 RepID=A0A177JUH6_SPHYA|nr:hypothetical protein AX777_20635 [Sphingobium yanoikuyae]
MPRVRLLLATGAIALAAGLHAPAYAQASAQRAEAGQTAKVDIPGGDLAKTLTQLGRKYGVQVAFLPDRVRGHRAKAVKGDYSIEQALEHALEGTGLRYQRTQNGTYIVGGPTAENAEKARKLAQDITAAEGIGATGKAEIPDILVTGRRDWTLNLDIPRTVDDAQPYVVFTREQIQRSGATSLDDFFRDYLGANTAGAASTQFGTTKNQSFINLRGLSTVGTLILVDGRRYAQSNSGNGIFSQSSVNGIPLDAIERVEVLASSASGIYGSNAVGGVINIILKRDYHGLEATAYYGNTTRGDDAERRLSLNGSFPLEGGRTRLAFTASWQKTQGLTEGDRDFIQRGRAILLANSPNYLNTLTTPVAGSLPNVISTNGSPLVLDAIYGGQSLGSKFTFVPAGYRGVALDGVAPLVANAGKQDLGLSASPQLANFGDGAQSPLLSPTQSYSGTISVRREFNKWLSLYGEFGYNHYESLTVTNTVAGRYSLPANSPFNPFTTAITISVPAPAASTIETFSNRNLRALTGAIIKLPLDWQAAIDLTWNWNRYSQAGIPPALSAATQTAISNNSLNFLSDPNANPLALSFTNRPASGVISDPEAFSRSYTFKLAGPLPLVRLPGGKPFLTLQFETDKQTQGQYVSFTDTPLSSNVTFTPARSQSTDSVYGELRLPILGKDNHIPLIRELELQAAVRYDHYTGVGANTSLACFPAAGTTFNGPLPDSAYTTPCPIVGSAPAFATTRNGSTNPIIAVRWAITQDLTLRGSYSTGYQPPALNAVVSVPAGIGVISGQSAVNVTDPLRGNEAIGTPLFPGFNLVKATIGGNPNVAPQTSTNWSFGAILTPRFIPGLRLSADWTRIIQNNVYFSPAILLNSGTTAAGQQAFNDFLQAHPERFTRSTDPSTFGAFGVGPIIAVDASTANQSYLRSESIDFAANYDRPFAGGQISAQANATLLLNLSSRATASSALQNGTGVIDPNFFLGFGGLGGVRWKGNGSIVYSNERWSLGASMRYFGPYFLNAAHTVNALQGSAKIPGQTYIDVFGSYKIFSKTTLRAGVNNVFDKSPPINVNDSHFYSYFGDPRRANFYLSVNQKF